MSELTVKDWVEWFNKCEECMTFMAIHDLMRPSERSRIQNNIKNKYDLIVSEVQNES